MINFENNQDKAELKQLGLSENPNLAEGSNGAPVSDSEIMFFEPVFSAGSENKEMIPVKAEVVDDETPEPIKALEDPAPRPPMTFCCPFYSFPVTSMKVYELARIIKSGDPAYMSLGFYYDGQLKRECEMLIPYAIPSYYPQGIIEALKMRRKNPGFFLCQAIDVILTRYLNELSMEYYDEQYR